MGDVTHWKRGLRFEKRQLVEFPPRKKKVDFQSWVRPDVFVRYGRRALVGLRADDVKAVSIERLCLSLLKSKNLLTQKGDCPVSWGCRIHWLHLCRGVRPHQTSVLDMTLNNLMVRFQQCWSFGECGVPLHCHRSQVHSGPEW